MEVAEKMCDFIFMIYKGNKVLDGTLSQIKDQYGADTIRIRWDGSSSALQRFEGVSRVTDMGQYQELQINKDPQLVLHQMVEQGSVSLFEIAQPSLNDIFIRIADPDSDDEEGGAEA